MQRIYCLNKQILAALQLSLPKRNYATKKQTKVTAAAPSVPKLPAQEITTENGINPGFLARTCGASYKKWDKALQSYPLLRKVKRNDFINTVASLKALNYTLDDMLSKPMILYTNAITIENRYSVLKESGFDTISIAILNKYVTVMNKSVSFLKSHNYLNYDLDVVRKLCDCFNDLELQMPSNECHEDMELKLIRQNILNLYLRRRLEMSDSDISKLWKVYARIRHKSFTSVRKIIDLLLTDLQFSNERINKNAYLLYADVENVKRILEEIPSISGHEMREIVYRRPKILMSSCDTLLRTLNHVKSFGIGEDAVLRCLEVLTLGSDTVLERLHDLNEVEEFQVLCTNPRILRLVHYQNKARLRLEYLNQLKVRCASLHILSCGSEAFEKFARDGSDRTKGRDIVVYLANVMDKDEHKIRNLLSRHPNWCHIPAMQVKQCYDFLQSKKFNVDSIYNNIHLLLYPIQRIEEKLHELYRNELLDGVGGLVNVDQLSNNELLTLILYFIECEFHFTGDGIWTEQHAHHVENFNNLLPDFPESLNKVYKYGMKPASSSSAIAQKLFMTQ